MKQLKVEIKLLEDLHSGSGMGNAALDSLLAIDRTGQPCLFWSHLKGVCMDHARATVAPLCAEMFGKSGGQVGSVCMTGARLLSNPAQSTSRLAHSSTARMPDSRAPLEDSLRTEEYVAAGSAFVADVQLPGAHVDAFKAVLQGVDCLGGDRRRGDGLLQISVTEVPLRIGKFDFKANQSIRVLLKALDPICMPLTNTPTTSLVHGAHFIRGQTLAGALANACIASHKPISQAIWNQQLLVSDALPLPEFESSQIQLSKLQVLPVPEDYRVNKPVTLATSDPPWWLDAPALALRLEGKKSPPDDAFIYNSGVADAPWHWFQTQARYRLRVQVPIQIDVVPGLFAMHELVEDTLFVAEITLPKGEEIAQHFNAFLNSGQWLRVGRGGRPVQIVNAVVLPAASESSDRFLLSSDLILRDPATFATLSALDADRAALFDLIRTRPAPASGVLVSGFNFASGLPRQPEWAIRRGAVVSKSSPSAAFQLGERQHEGFGRFVPMPEIPYPIAAYPHRQAVVATISAAELLLCKALGIYEGCKAELNRISRSNRSGFYMALQGKSDADAIRAAQTFCESTKARAALLDLVSALQRNRQSYAGQLPELAYRVIEFSLAEPELVDE